MDELLKYMKALVFLQLQTQTGGGAYSKPELLLQKAGFKTREIASLLGRTEAAVAKTISRANLAAREANTDD